MKVQDLMTSPVQSCGVDTNLAAAAGMMWDSDCGILPVVDRSGKVVGMISDRDICMAVATKGRKASEIAVWESITGKVFSCLPEDDIHNALKMMAENRVRRLPVVDRDGALLGVLAVNDVILHAGAGGGAGKKPELSATELVTTLRAICQHRMMKAAA